MLAAALAAAAAAAAALAVGVRHAVVAVVAAAVVDCVAAVVAAAVAAAVVVVGLCGVDSRQKKRNGMKSVGKGEKAVVAGALSAEGKGSTREGRTAMGDSARWGAGKRRTFTFTFRS
jgi:membrane protein implicated in regulation of membrane protease activity